MELTASKPKKGSYEATAPEKHDDVMETYKSCARRPQSLHLAKSTRLQKKPLRHVTSYRRLTQTPSSTRSTAAGNAYWIQTNQQTTNYSKINWINNRWFGAFFCYNYCKILRECLNLIDFDIRKHIRWCSTWMLTVESLASYLFGCIKNWKFLRNVDYL